MAADIMVMVMGMVMVTVPVITVPITVPTTGHITVLATALIARPIIGANNGPAGLGFMARV